MEEELGKSVKEWVDYQIEKQAELEKIYLPNPPNEEMCIRDRSKTGDRSE